MATNREACAKWYAENKEAKLKYQRERQRITLDYIQDIKMARGCERCGYSKSPRALQFHHLEPTDKKHTIARMAAQGRSTKEIDQEISKCIVLCANCHAELHDE